MPCTSIFRCIEQRMKLDEFAKYVKLCHKNLQAPEKCEVVYVKDGEEFPIVDINLDLSESTWKLKLGNTLSKEELPW